MFFEKEMLSFNLLDVLELKQQDVHMFNSSRNFSALSFRYSADALLKTKDDEYGVKDNFVAYVPAGLDYSRTAKRDEMIVIHLNMTNYHTKKIECFEAKDPAALLGLFCEILDCWNRKELGYQHKCSALLYEIFAECYIQNFKPQTKCSKIQKSVDYIFEHYKESDLSMEEIAKQSFMSEVYFRKLFKAEYGITPQKHIIYLRMQNAVDLISAGYYSLKEVALLSGYNDYKHFSVEFKKLKGVSPSEYLYSFQE